MANICFTTIELHNENEKELVELLNKLQGWLSTIANEKSYNENWLENIVINSEIGTPNDFCCRGRVTEMHMEGMKDKYIYIQTETAWCPCLRMFLAIIDKHSPGTKLIYRADETSMGIIDTNDDTYAGKYLFDPWGDNIEEAYDDCVDDDYLIGFLQKYYNTKETDIDKLLDLFDEDKDKAFSIHQWEYTEASYWD